MSRCRSHRPALKAKIAVSALAGDATLTELAQRFEFHAHQISTWREQLLVLAPDVLALGGRPRPLSMLQLSTPRSAGS